MVQVFGSHSAAVAKVLGRDFAFSVRVLVLADHGAGHRVQCGQSRLVSRQGLFHQAFRLPNQSEQNQGNEFSLCAWLTGHRVGRAFGTGVDVFASSAGRRGCRNHLVARPSRTSHAEVNGPCAPGINATADTHTAAWHQDAVGKGMSYGWPLTLRQPRAQSAGAGQDQYQGHRATRLGAIPRFPDSSSKGNGKPFARVYTPPQKRQALLASFQISVGKARLNHELALR